MTCDFFQESRMACRIGEPVGHIDTGGDGVSQVCVQEWMLLDGLNTSNSPTTPVLANRITIPAATSTTGSQQSGSSVGLL